MLLSVTLTSAVAVGEPWLRSGFDPGRTGAIPFEGPQTNDTAFVVELPGVPEGDVVLIDGAAYVLTLNGSRLVGGSEALNQTAVWRIELATGASEEVLKLPDGSFPRGMTQELVLYQETEDLVAASLTTGEEAWRVAPREGTPEDRVLRHRYIGRPVSVSDTLYIGFEATPTPDRDATLGDITGLAPLDLGWSYDDPEEARSGVLALDRGTGEKLWMWAVSDGYEEIQAQIGDDPGPADPRQPNPLPPTMVDGMALSADEQRVYLYIKHLSQHGAGAREAEVDENWTQARDQRIQYTLWAIEEGQTRWYANDTEQVRRDVYAPRPIEDEQLADEGIGTACCAAPVVSPTSVATRLDNFVAFNKVDATEEWSSSQGRSDQEKLQGARGMGMRGDIFIGTSDQTAFRLENGEPVWKETDPTQGKRYWTFPAVLDEGMAYLSFGHNLDLGCGGIAGPGLEARDLETGELVWDWRYTPLTGTCSNLIGHAPAFGPGVMVQGAKDGTIHIVGETDASIGPFLVADERFPPAGENVTIDLSGTGPGAFGPPTKYRVFWGDGTVTGWQNSTTFTHAYNDSGDVTARLQAGNDANQTASTLVTMRVGAQPPIDGERYPPVGEAITLNVTEAGLAANGADGADGGDGGGDGEADHRYRVFWGDGTVSPWQASPVFNHTYDEPGNTTARLEVADASNETASAFIAMHVGIDPPPSPPEPTLLQEAFARENQDLTFGVLGILVAVTGGAIGVTQRYRKRSRLQEELEAIEALFAQTKHRPGKCEAQLTERKAHARGLLTDGYLTEEQFGVVEGRIEELKRELRLSAVDDEFAFLPYSLVTSLREMLEDGRVTTMEKAGFLAALEADDLVHPDQKAVVRQRIEQWFARDASRGGGRA